MSKTVGRIRKFFKALGPGFVTGASDDDPSGIAAYSQTGAMFGYSQLWTALFTFPFMTVIQEMCGRIGIVTGKGLSGVIRKHYPKSILYFAVSLLLIANTVNIGADLGAMAASAKLVFGMHFVFWLFLIAAITLALQILIPYEIYSRFLKYATFSLLAYIIAVFFVRVEWLDAIKSTFVPKISFTSDYLMNIVAILGTTISPYLFFWQASHEVEEEVKTHRLRTMGAGIPHFSKRDIKGLRLDTVLGMLFSNLVMYFIILTTASTLGRHGIANIETADQAAEALRPVAGDFAYLLFAMGIIGTGFLAIPVLAGSASYALSEAMGWKEGLYRKYTQARGFYGVIIAAIVIGLFINFTPITPFKLLYYTAVLNGICAPPLMALILLVSNNEKIMGKYTNNSITNVLGWMITAVMTIAAVALIVAIV